MSFPNRDTQFKPGNPGGPGRPRKRPITDRLLEQLGATEYEGWILGPGETVADLVAQEWIRLIIVEQDTQALRELLARLEGRVPMKIEADVTVEDDDHDLEGILTSLGYAKQGRRQADAGPVKPSRPGGGRKQRKVEVSAAPRPAERKPAQSRQGDRKKAKPAAGHHHAAKARKK